MSLILDALNRSDSDRERPETPGLQTNHGPPPGQGGDWKRFIWPALVLVLLVAAILPWLWSDDESAVSVQQSQRLIVAPTVKTEAAATPEPALSRPGTPQQDTRQQNTRQQVPAKPVPVQGERATEIAAGQGLAPADPEIAALYQSAGATPQAQQAVVATVEPLEAPAITLGVVSPPEAGPRPAPQPQPQSVLDVEALAAAAERALIERSPTGRSPTDRSPTDRSPTDRSPTDRSPTDNTVVAHAAPDISELSQREKDQIPSVFYNSHFWASNPRERSVVLNGQSYREGDQVKSGLKLVEILEDSIVLSYQGTEFQLRSLNSWVNL